MLFSSALLCFLPNSNYIYCNSVSFCDYIIVFIVASFQIRSRDIVALISCVIHIDKTIWNFSTIEIAMNGEKERKLGLGGRY
jgi:hypothetical protein